MKTLKDLKATMLQNPEFKAEYDVLASEFDMARELVAIDSRLEKPKTPDCWASTRPHGSNRRRGPGIRKP